MSRVHAIRRPAAAEPAAASQQANAGPFEHSARSVAQKARLAAFQAPVQRIPMSQSGMENCGFGHHGGDEWIWYSGKGVEPNHISAIRTGGNVDHIHAKTQYKGNKVNRVDWTEGADGTFNGPVEKYKQADDKWDGFIGNATAAGEETIRLLKANRKK